MQTLIPLTAGLGLGLICVWVWARFFGFRGQSPVDYVGDGPDFDLRTHLNGTLICEGVIYGPLGKVSSRFVAEMRARWNGDSGEMTEEFWYSSGARQKRKWNLSVDQDGRVVARAPDVIGTGSGWQKGDAVCLNYQIRLPESAGGHVLNTTDWMYLLQNGAIINRSQFRKFGFKVGELVATMRKI